MREKISGCWTGDHHDGEIYRGYYVESRSVYQCLLTLPMLSLPYGFSYDTSFSVFPYSELYKLFLLKFWFNHLYSAQRFFTDFSPLNPNFLLQRTLSISPQHSMDPSPKYNGCDPPSSPRGPKAGRIIASPWPQCYRWLSIRPPVKSFALLEYLISLWGKMIQKHQSSRLLRIVDGSQLSSVLICSENKSHVESLRGAILLSATYSKVPKSSKMNWWLDRRRNIRIVMC